jgi:hypothetical protein
VATVVPLRLLVDAIVCLAEQHLVHRKTLLPPAHAEILVVETLNIR